MKTRCEVGVAVGIGERDDLVTRAQLRGAPNWYELAASDQQADPRVLPEVEVTDRAPIRWGTRLDQVAAHAAVLAESGRPGELRLVNCGHPPPLRFRGTAELLASLPPATPLCSAPAPTVQRFTLAPTDRLLLYADGPVEARAPDGRPFELDGQVVAVLAASSWGGALDGLVAHLLEHAGPLGRRPCARSARPLAYLAKRGVDVPGLLWRSHRGARG